MVSPIDRYLVSARTEKFQSREKTIYLGACDDATGLMPGYGTSG